VVSTFTNKLALYSFSEKTTHITTCPDSTATAAAAAARGVRAERLVEAQIYVLFAHDYRITRHHLHCVS
jgi:hypothetical protein